MRMVLTWFGLLIGFSLHAAEIYVSPVGNDSKPGTLNQPVAALAQAQELDCTAAKNGAIIVYLHDGTHSLSSPLVFTAADSGPKWPPSAIRRNILLKKGVTPAFQVSDLSR